MGSLTEIPGLTVKILKVNKDNRGYLVELLRSDDAQFRGFGQTYVSGTVPGAVRAWHKHATNYEYFCCISGDVLLGLCDLRPGGEHKACGAVLSGEAPVLVGVPAGVGHGVAVLGDTPAILVDFNTEPYNHASPDKIMLSVPADVSMLMEEMRDEYLGNRRSWLYRL